MIDTETRQQFEDEVYLICGDDKKTASRIQSNSKKKAREKAFLKGRKRPLIHYPSEKHGPHYHPNTSRFSHWVYYYLWLLLFVEDEE